MMTDCDGRRFGTRWGDIDGGAWEKDGQLGRDRSGKVLIFGNEKTENRG